MEGILLVDKPADWTSFDVVNYVRRIVAESTGSKPKSVKVGHSGTLDPFATGLLILLVGKNYTKRANEYTKLDKTYEFSACLGQTSSTGDIEGDITKKSDRVPTLKEVEEVTNSFKGEILQTPPKYSAIKVNGKRSYELAREGKEVKHKARRVRINSIELLSFDYPEVKIRADVSSGTYIRSLAEDIGQKLGTGAYTKELRRTSVNGYKIADAIGVKDLTKTNIRDRMQVVDI
ncbi:MAG TPA: tRNA pseudouridine(55) synthase TruB [Candidatus Sulfotelmatobacter sp.]|nr:tRNA pseudouridine(55) synthase TruB [Candidatus Sulfotelmatobacter sp.]